MFHDPWCVYGWTGWPHAPRCYGTSEACPMCYHAERPACRALFRSTRDVTRHGESSRTSRGKGITCLWQRADRQSMWVSHTARNSLTTLARAINDSPTVTPDTDIFGNCMVPRSDEQHQASSCHHSASGSYTPSRSDANIISQVYQCWIGQASQTHTMSKDNPTGGWCVCILWIVVVLGVGRIVVGLRYATCMNLTSPHIRDAMVHVRKIGPTGLKPVRCNAPNAKICVDSVQQRSMLNSFKSGGHDEEEMDARGCLVHCTLYIVLHMYEGCFAAYLALYADCKRSNNSNCYIFSFNMSAITTHGVCFEMKDSLDTVDM